MQMRQHFSISGQFAAAHSLLTAELVSSVTSTSNNGSGPLLRISRVLPSDQGRASELSSVHVVSSATNTRVARRVTMQMLQPVDEGERILALQVSRCWPAARHAFIVAGCRCKHSQLMLHTYHNACMSCCCADADQVCGPGAHVCSAAHPPAVGASTSGGDVSAGADWCVCWPDKPSCNSMCCGGSICVHQDGLLLLSCKLCGSHMHAARHHLLLLLPLPLPQGDKEKALGLPIAPLCDRHGVGITESQVGLAVVGFSQVHATVKA